MIPLRALRAHPHYADLFDHVPMLLWPVLWWQLNAMIRWMRSAGVLDVCFSTSVWGFITIRHAGFAPDPDLYRPLPRLYRTLTDPAWGSDLPPCVDPGLPAWHNLVLPCACGGDGILRSRPPESALAPLPNTS